jgi:hypothetical protein
VQSAHPVLLNPARSSIGWAVNVNNVERTQNKEEHCMRKSKREVLGQKDVSREVLGLWDILLDGSKASPESRKRLCQRANLPLLKFSTRKEEIQENFDKRDNL